MLTAPIMKDKSTWNKLQGKH